MVQSAAEWLAENEDSPEVELYVSIAQQSDGAWLCYWSEQPNGIEEYAARRTRATATAWARDVLEVKRIDWDTTANVDAQGRATHLSKTVRR